MAGQEMSYWLKIMTSGCNIIGIISRGHSNYIINQKLLLNIFIINTFGKSYMLTLSYSFKFIFIKSY